MNEPEAHPRDEAYWQGLMDGISTAFPDDVPDRRERIEQARLRLAARKHVHYSSIIGPYCVICHADIPAPYNSFWSEP